MVVKPSAVPAPLNAWMLPATSDMPAGSALSASVTFQAPCESAPRFCTTMA